MYFVFLIFNCAYISSQKSSTVENTGDCKLENKVLKAEVINCIFKILMTV